MHFSQTTSFSCILGRAVKSTARVQLGLNHDYKPETLQQKHLQCSGGLEASKKLLFAFVPQGAAKLQEVIVKSLSHKI